MSELTACHVAWKPWKLNETPLWNCSDDCRLFNMWQACGNSTQIAKFMGPTWGPPGSCQPLMGPKLAPWTLLLGLWCLICENLNDTLDESSSTGQIMSSLIAWYMGPTWGQTGANRTQVGPMLVPWSLLSGILLCYNNQLFPINALRPRQNGRHLPDNIFRLYFLEWKCINFDENFT